jgi:hypothetical protein
MTQEELHEYKQVMKAANRVFVAALVIILLAILGVTIYNYFN